MTDSTIAVLGGATSETTTGMLVVVVVVVDPSKPPERLGAPVVVLAIPEDTGRPRPTDAVRLDWLLFRDGTAVGTQLGVLPKA